MDPYFNELQQALRRAAKDFLQRECKSDLVREVLDGPIGHSPELWRKMADLGWLGLILPEQYGGGGGTLLDLAALCEEFGRALLPTTFYSTVGGALAILNCGTEAQKQALLPEVCLGHTLVTLALTESEGSYDPKSLTTVARRAGEDWVIDGVKLFVHDAQSADYVIVVARDDSEAENDISAFLVPANSPGVSMSPLVTFGRDRQAEVCLTKVNVPGAGLLGQSGRAWPGIEKTLQFQTALQLADTIGIGQEVLDRTVEYLKARVQFGVPIASFQAARHHCANMAMDLDGARFLSYDAIWRLSEGMPAAKELSMAKAFGPDAVARITAMSHRLHGGIGISTEYDLHLYSARAKAASLVLGTPLDHLDLLAQQLEI